jgi:hypothetical protein
MLGSRTKQLQAWSSKPLADSTCLNEKPTRYRVKVIVGFNRYHDVAAGVAVSLSRADKRRLLAIKQGCWKSLPESGA